MTMVARSLTRGFRPAYSVDVEEGATVGRCLIIANQTLGGEELDRAVRDRIARDVRRFFILVPTTPPIQESSAWTFGFSAETEPSPGRARTVVEQDLRRREARFEARFEARRRARRRLDQMIERIRSAGGEASGEVGESDPVAAARTVLQTQTFDEVIVSTLPAGLSRWMKMDLPARVGRMSHAPVTIVEAEAVGS
jgi:hypothetical protein